MAEALADVTLTLVLVLREMRSPYGSRALVWRPRVALIASGGICHKCEAPNELGGIRSLLNRRR